MANGQNIWDAELQAKQLVDLISPVVRASPGRYIKSALDFPTGTVFFGRRVGSGGHLAALSGGFGTGQVRTQEASLGAQMIESKPGLLTRGGARGPPGPLGLSIPSGSIHFPLNLHAIHWKFPTIGRAG
jgi:hypothetical protein